MEEHKLERSTRRLPSIRLILGGVVVAVVLPLLALLVAYGAWNVELQRELLDRTLQQQAAAVSLAVDGELKGIASALVTLSTSGNIDDDGLSTLYARAGQLAAAQGGWIVLTDATHKTVFNTLFPLGAELPKEKPAAEPELATHVAAYASGQPAYTDLFVDTTKGQPVISITAPVLRDGKVAYTLGIAVTAEHLSHVLNAQGLPNGMVASLVDRQDIIIARSDNATSVIGQKVLSWLSKAALPSREGIVGGVSRSGVDIYAAFTRSPVTGWTTVLSQPVDAFREPVRRAFNLVAGGGITSLILALGAGWYLGRRITQPLRRLARNAGTIIGGQSPYPPEEPIAEVAKLRIALLDAAIAHREKVAARIQLQWERESRNAAEAAHQEILRRDARFRRLIDANLIGILVANEHGLVEANDAFLKIIGYRRDEIGDVMRQWSQMTPVEYHGNDQDAILEILQHNECSPYEKAFIHKNGSLVYVLIGCAKVEASDLTWICFVIDRTQQKQAEMDLRSSEERYRALTEAIASIVWVASADGSMIDIAAWHAITGQSDQECSGWGWLNALHPSDRLRVGEAWHRSVERLDSYDIEYRVRCQDGSYHWYNARGVPVRNGDGTVREWVGVCIDIEGRKAAEERQILLMAELDHRVRNILASIAAMVSLTAQGAATKEEYARRLHGRIGTMARTHGLLTQQKWKGANLHRLVQDELAIYGRAPDSITIGGEPADFILRPPTALNLSLILHELATNAAKYGALSVATGRVSVTWTRIAGEDGASLQLDWREIDGPPVSQPTKMGFGCTLIGNALSAEAGSEVTLEFEPAGVRCRILLPLGDESVQRDPSPAASVEELRLQTRVPAE